MKNVRAEENLRKSTRIGQGKRKFKIGEFYDSSANLDTEMAAVYNKLHMCDREDAILQNMVLSACSKDPLRCISKT